jgi:hypothetical protein
MINIKPGTWNLWNPWNFSGEQTPASECFWEIEKTLLPEIGPAKRFHRVHRFHDGYR